MFQENLFDLKKKACLQDIPVIKDETEAFLRSYIIEENVQSILEIGGAVGYSSLFFASIKDDIKVTTVEKDKKRSFLARKNIASFEIGKRIKVIESDALFLSIEEKYDLIFIDASKSQYQKFFDKFKYNINEKGSIIFDNIDFHGIVSDLSLTKSRSTKQLVRKINLFISFLKEDFDFSTRFFHTGDGISISKRKPDLSNFVSESNLLLREKSFCLYKMGEKKILKLFDSYYKKDEVLKEYRTFLIAEENGIPCVKALETGRAGNAIGIIFDVSNEKFNFLSKIIHSENLTEKNLNDFISGFSLLHKKVLQVSSKVLPSYKEKLIEKAGGHRVENASIIRKIKKLPEGNTFCHGSFCFKNILVSEKNNEFLVFNFQESSLGPREYDIALTYFLLLRDEKKDVASLYLENMGYKTESLLPFLEVISVLYNG